MRYALSAPITGGLEQSGLHSRPSPCLFALFAHHHIPEHGPAGPIAGGPSDPRQPGLPDQALTTAWLPRSMRPNWLRDGPGAQNVSWSNRC